MSTKAQPKEKDQKAATKPITPSRRAVIVKLLQEGDLDKGDACRKTGRSEKGMA